MRYARIVVIRVLAEDNNAYMIDGNRMESAEDIFARRVYVRAPPDWVDGID